MAIKSDITAADLFFIGEDKQLEYEVLDADGLPVDVVTLPMQWVLRGSVREADPPRISKTTSGGGITVTGVYNATRALNTQRVLVTIADTDTDALSAQTYKCALKRTDDGSESVLSYGDVVLLQAAAR
jgi:hypothetical protein